MRKTQLLIIVVILNISCNNNNSNDIDTLDFGNYVYNGFIDTSVSREAYRFNSELFIELIETKQYHKAAQYLQQFTFKDSINQNVVKNEISDLEYLADYFSKHYNDSIQGCFYGSCFGDSKINLLDNLNKHGFVVDKRYSTDCVIHFTNRDGRFFSFGNINFEFLIAEFDNDSFIGIEFIISNRNKSESLKVFEDILAKCKQKYNIVQDDVKNESKIAYASGITMDGRNIVIVCESYYPFDSQTIMYRTALVYRDNFYLCPNEEL